MSAEELARFDTRTRIRTAQTDERSEQTDFRAVGAREHGQLALDELDIETERRVTAEEHTSTGTQTTGEPTRADLETALECARATIDGLQERVQQLEVERDRLHAETQTNTEGDR